VLFAWLVDFFFFTSAVRGASPTAIFRLLRVASFGRVGGGARLLAHRQELEARTRRRLCGPAKSELQP
jgi:hypothetical protein